MARRRFSGACFSGLLIIAIIAMVCGYLCLCGQDSRSMAVAQQATGGETGRYFALVIGIDKYPAPIKQLRTAATDARSMADLLRQQFGFQVKLLTDADATRSRILDQLASYQLQLSADDNLLIYYAGHGFRIEAADKSFWLPVDATSELSSNRISSDDLTTVMATLKARHVLVISDSCYSGGLTRNIDSLPAIRPDEAFLQKTLAMRSRNFMASGRDEPVADGGPEGHSVFAWAVLHALAGQSDSLFTASSLFYGSVQRAVAGNSEQIPVYQPIRNSGDIGGDFVFRRVSASSTEVKTRLAAGSTGYDRGLAYYHSADFAHATSAYSESCNGGEFRSCTLLGYMYEHGKGVTQNDAQALALDRKGCDGGDALGCTNLGYMYRYGKGVAQDDGQALALYRKGCDGGNAHGCSNLGTMYEHGRGVAQDDAKAGAFYRKGCVRGDGLGCTNLGYMYRSGRGVTQDDGQALALYRKGCDGGDAHGCTNLGTMYERGKGVTQDVAKAVALYRASCDRGDALGCSNLGIMYENGKGVTRDSAGALALYRKGCDGGDADGCANLKRLQEQGHVP